MTDAGGLEISGAVGVGSRLEQEIHNGWDTFDEMETQMAKQGFPPVEKPPYARPTLTPRELSTAKGERFTELHVQFSSWHSYAANLIARIRGSLSQIDNELSHLGARLKQGIIEAARQEGKKKPSEEEIKDSIILDPRVVQLTQEHQRLDQQRLVLESHADSLARDLRVISRQLELRRQELEEGMQGSVGYRPQIRPPGRLG